MSTAVLSDPQFGVGRRLVPYAEVFSNKWYRVTEPFTVPVGNTAFNVVAEPVSAALPSTVSAFTDKYPIVSIPGVGAFYLLGVSGNTITLINSTPGVCNPWTSDNQTGTFDPSASSYYVTPPGGYDGAPGQIPIMFTEDGKALDPSAGKPGYSSSLLRGLPVPFGSRVLLWLPKLNQPCNDSTESSPQYQWQFMFRLRSLADFKATRSAYHLIGSEPSSSGLNPIPVATNGVIYNSSEPSSSIASIVTQRVLQEGFRTQDPSPFPPFVPGGVPFPSYGQGVSDKAGDSEVLFDILEVQCAGDELLIGLTKTTGFWDWEVDGSVYSFRNSTGSKPLLPYYAAYAFTGSAT